MDEERLKRLKQLVWATDKLQTIAVELGFDDAMGKGRSAEEMLLSLRLRNEVEGTWDESGGTWEESVGELVDELCEEADSLIKFYGEEAEELIGEDAPIHHITHVAHALGTGRFEPQRYED